MRQITYYVATLTALLATAGCIDYSETVTIDARGRGDVSLYYTVTSDFQRDFRDADNETLRAENDKLKDCFVADGITISRTSVEDRDDTRFYAADFSFADDQALNRIGFFENFSTFEIKSGKTLEYERTLLANDDSGKKAEDETTEKLAALYDDNLFTFSVRMPAPVISSNGTISDDGYSVNWVYTFGEILTFEKPVKMTAECRITE